MVEGFFAANLTELRERDHDDMHIEFVFAKN